MTSFPVFGSGNEVIQDGGRKRKGRHLGWPHSRNRRLRLNGGRKTRPKSWLTSLPAPPSWIQDGGATRNVWKTSELPWNPQKGIELVQKRPIDVWSFFFFYYLQKHLIVSLPQPFSKWLRELAACHYGEVDQSARVNITFHEAWCWLRQAPTLLFLDFRFFIFLTVLYNSLELLYSTMS